MKQFLKLQKIQMINYKLFIYFISAIISTSSNSAFGTEFTFELPDSSNQCFHEIIRDNISCTLEFQVSGNNEFCGKKKGSFDLQVKGIHFLKIL